MSFQSASLLGLGDNERMLTQICCAIRRFRAGCLFLGISTLLPLTAVASDYDPEDLINVSYIHAAVLGTGTYSLRERRVTMLKLPFAWNQRPATPESVGWRWLAPTVLGYDDLSAVDSDLIDALLPDQLLTLSVMPGVEFIYPVNEHWYLKPFVEIGGWQRFSAGRDLFSHSARGAQPVSVRARRTLAASAWRCPALGGGVSAALRGYERVRDRRSGAGRPPRPALEAVRAAAQSGGLLHLSALPSRVAGGGRRTTGRTGPLEVHEFGLSLGVPHGKKILGINVRRIRVGYKKGGKFHGWTFGTEFPF